MSNKKERDKYLIIGVIVFAVIAMLVLVLIWLFTNNHETLISEDANYGTITSLECHSDHIEKSFFDPESAQRYTHLITATFKGDRLDNISYNYDGTYRSEGVADSELARMHADYNKYMGSVDVYSESLNPVFNAIKSKLKISLYGEPKTLNEAVMVLFFLEKEDYGKFKDLSGKDFKKRYESKGFDCTFHE